MSNKRGSPVLIEVLKGKPTFPGVGSGAAAGVTGNAGAGGAPPSPAKAAPPPAQPPIATYISEGSPSRWPKLRDIRLTPRSMAIGLGVLVPILGVVWVVGFRSGQTAEKQQWEGRWVQQGGASLGGVGGVSEPGPIPPDPLNSPRNDPSGGNALITPGNNEPREPDGNANANPTPRVETTAQPAALQDGMNHLVVGTFRRFTDAEASAKFLSANRMTVIVTGPRGVDPTPKTNEWWVWIADAYERPGSSPEAARLKARVVETGRLWKLQNKLAPTDFSQPYWAKYRKPAGKD